MKYSFPFRLVLLCGVAWCPVSPLFAGVPIRVATFNVSLYGESQGALLSRLQNESDPQICAIAEIIQRIRPDILFLNEFDYVDPSEAPPGAGPLTLLQNNYLAKGQNRSGSPGGAAEPIEYPYSFVAPSNTGIHSGYDLDRNGRVDPKTGSGDYGGDSWGFGRFPGQYGMAVLSRYPIDAAKARTFRGFLWKDMPGALLPDNDETPEPDDWYPPEVLERFPLSSKSHWDVPVKVNGQTIHLLASHPTPPVYDGPEDRNGRRNHDEIRFFADYIGPKEDAVYIYDDTGNHGGLARGASFVVVGDLNSDPPRRRRLGGHPASAGEPASPLGADSLLARWGRAGYPTGWSQRRPAGRSAPRYGRPTRPRRPGQPEVRLRVALRRLCRFGMRGVLAKRIGPSFRPGGSVPIPWLRPPAGVG